MPTQFGSVQGISNETLDARAAAEHCEFLLEVFNTWVRRGLLPSPTPSTRGWTKEELDSAIDYLVRSGFQQTPNKKSTAYIPLPNVHRVPRTDGLGRVKFHYRRRGMRGPLPREPSSPEFMRALIAKERQLWSQQKTKSATASTPPTEHSESYHAAATPTHETTARPQLAPERNIEPGPAHKLSDSRPGGLLTLPRRRASRDLEPRPSTRVKLQDVLAYPPLGLRAERAAAYLGMSRSKFLDLVARGKLPRPKIIDGIRVWNRLELESAFSELGEDASDVSSASRNTFDDIIKEG